MPITARITKWNSSYTAAFHKDIDLTDVAYWEPPAGWQVAAIAFTEKGLPEWGAPTPAEEAAAVADPNPAAQRPARYGGPVLHTEFSSLNDD